ncbi:MAG: protein kinase, partial [Anaerolineae bacterium]|nr:protein kinase [Anaerolineae bacterium]
MQDPLLGKQLANFRIESPLGKGGMARVYYGVDVTLQRPVAIKVLSDMLRDEDDFNRRFVDEARMVATWRHENIIQVYYAGEEDGLAYFVMEYVDGISLDRRLAELSSQGAIMPVDEVLKIGWAV